MSNIKSLEHIKVRVPNIEKLKELFAIQVPDNQRLNIRKECLYADAFLINTDCMFSEVTKFYHKNNIQKCIILECSFDTKNSDDAWQIGTTRFGHIITFNEFLVHSELVPITEFIRYNYNPRIISNQNLLLEYINDLDCKGK